MVCSFFLSSLFGDHPSQAYVIMGTIIASTICHIAFIFMPLNSLFPVSARILEVAPRTFFSISFMWSVRLPLLLMVSPRYLYVFTSSSTSPFSFRLLFLPFPFLITLHFAAPNCMWYLSATWLVTSSIVCKVSRSWWIRHTSSIHRSESIFILPFVFRPSPFSFSSLDISSIRAAYSITDRTPPCLILSLILIFLVRPYLVCIFAVRLELSFLAILRFLPSIPFLWRVYSIASNQALSYAFCTSRNIMYAVFLFFVISWIASLSTIRWSVVELPGFPPAWAFVICSSFFILSFIILSYTFPTLLANVMPLSFEHFPLVPFPLYSLIISPSSHAWGMFSDSCAFSIMAFNIFLVSGVPSMNISFGILSGPRLFFLFSFFLLRCWILLCLSHCRALHSAGVLAPGALFQLSFWSIYYILGCLLWLGIALQSS